MTTRDCTEVLRLDLEGQPGGDRIDSHEVEGLFGLFGLSDLHLITQDHASRVVAHVLALSGDDEHDGEEFLRFSEALDSTFIWIDQVVVSNYAHAAGVGTTLYKELADVARVNGISTICCEVNARSPSPGSAAFHIGMGFHVSGLLSTRDGRNVDIYTQDLKWSLLFGR